MEQHEKEMQLIAALSGELGDDHVFIQCEGEDVDHLCEKRGNERIQLHLDEVEYFKEGQVRSARANFCEYCNQVFINKS